MVRAGLLNAIPVRGSANVVRGGYCGPYGEIPDVDLTHRYAATEAGRAVLARTRKC
jgi:hypothetical protein